MPTKTTRTIHTHQHHFGWDNSFPAVTTVAPGDMIEIRTVDSSDDQICDDTTAADILKMDFGRFCPLSGPIKVDGARPGDILKITIDTLIPYGTGWTAVVPPFGLLIEDFSEPALHHWRYDPLALRPVAFGRYAHVPLRPFIGTIGLAQGQSGWHSAIPPRRVGGNMDIRDMSQGTVLYLPVEVEGALLSVGDTHAAQGDGEVCGTALESRLDVVLQIELIPDKHLRFPRLETASSVCQPPHNGYDVTTGIGPDLMQNARDALRGMIDLLTERHGMPAIDAYMLCSVCGDLRISDIVDMPNWVVSFYLPRSVFD